MGGRPDAHGRDQDDLLHQRERDEHALIFAKINEGYTLEEAYELEGEKGSATTVAEGGVKPGETAEIPVKGKIEPGSYAMLCPIPGHYQQGQLEEFDIE